MLKSKCALGLSHSKSGVMLYVGIGNVKTRPLASPLSMTARYGLPYFQNFINSELKPNMIRSMCCRLQLDLRELLKRGNGLFGSAEQTGSLGVVTINCA